MLGTLVVVGALTGAAPAWGGTASVELTGGTGCVGSGNLAYRAAPGEVNQLKFTLGLADVTPVADPCSLVEFAVAAAISDTAGVTAGSQCHSARPTAAVCLSTALLRPLIELGDRNDTLRLAVSGGAETGVPSTFVPGAGTFGADIDAGTGDDNLTTANGATDTVDCGDGVDTITADASDQLVNCENVTLTPA
jgi:hypothetical protein